LEDNVLLMVSAGIGLFTGLVSLIIGKLVLLDFVSMTAEALPGFILAGFLVGYSFASIMTGVVVSALNTVIVQFAESSAEFQQIHS
jgi:hypothetical protein